ncbi:mandelate racemase/muconate lactonizing enzyme family protein [Fodinicola feengrottensis]|uniref:Dipeptide epimerase n=1 Tax=Fodinicola feengrottensis TaxID=435914 RepID=A0ABN2IRN5_9ACTN|nr:dipeptide epimerase [Fodinicola feengrottensis]
MTITEVRVHQVSVPLHTPWVTAVRRTEVVESLLVEIVDADGRSGWGEGVATWKITGDSLPGMAAAVAGPLAEAVTGRDPADLDDLCRAVGTAVVGNTAAKAAVDCALHDLAAVRLGVPLSQLLGAAPRLMPTDVTLALGPVAEMAEAAGQRVAEGFRVLKVKVGGDPVEDLHRLVAIRKAAGPGTVIRLDANQGWTAREAVRIVSQLEDADLGIELVEQPVPAGDLDGLAFVSARVSTPVAADETVWSPADLVEIVRRRAADVVNIKLAKSGGLRPARGLVAVAEASGVQVMVGSMMESHVGIGAAASLAAVTRTPYAVDLDAAWWLKHSPVTGGPSYEGPDLRLAAAPGLGITGLRP